MPFSRGTKSNQQRSENNIFLDDATIFLATDFFSFITIFCSGFTPTEKQYVKVIDDTCNRKIKFKEKSEMTKS